jgi:hypothetical protein
MEAHYTIEKTEHEWLVLVNGSPELCCKSRKMAERIRKQATLTFAHLREEQTLSGTEVSQPITEAMRGQEL